MDIRRLVGEYATGSLFDLAVLLASGYLKSHTHALAHVRLEFHDVDKAVHVINPQMFEGVRFLKLDTTTDNQLERLIALAPRLSELDMGHCRNLKRPHNFSGLVYLTKLTMTGFRHFSAGFSDALRDLELTQCGPIGGDLSMLNRLTLHSCTIEQVHAMSPTLEYLELNANYSALDLEDWSADAWDLKTLTRLKVLKISTSHSLQNDHAAGISHMADLHSLTLTSCPNVTDFSFLKSLSKLRHLQVSNTFDWSKLKHVELETFSATEFTLEQLLCLSSQRRLQFLRIDQGRGDHRVDPGPVLSSLLPQWQELRMLDLFFCTELIETGGFSVYAGLKCLKIDFCKHINDSKLKQLLLSFPCLEILSAKFTSVSDSSLAFLPRSINDLSVRGCSVTDRALPSLKALKNLTNLDISRTDITGIDQLPKSLKTLYITGSGSISPESLLILRRKHVKIVQDY